MSRSGSREHGKELRDAGWVCGPSGSPALAWDGQSPEGGAACLTHLPPTTLRPSSRPPPSTGVSAPLCRLSATCGPGQLLILWSFVFLILGGVTRPTRALWTEGRCVLGLGSMLGGQLLLGPSTPPHPSGLGWPILGWVGGLGRACADRWARCPRSVGSPWTSPAGRWPASGEAGWRRRDVPLCWDAVGGLGPRWVACLGTGRAELPNCGGWPDVQVIPNSQVSVSSLVFAIPLNSPQCHLHLVFSVMEEGRAPDDPTHQRIRSFC